MVAAAAARSDALYMAATERPKNKNVMQTLQNGLADCRVFSSRMPQDVCMFPC